MSGYVRPDPHSLPPYDDALEDILHDIFMGISGLPPQLVRPNWQPSPPAQPVATEDWMAFGAASFPIIEFPVIQQISATQQQESAHEDLPILCSFYGPHCGATMALFRAGLYIPQNRALIKAQGLNFVGTARPIRIPDLVNAQWINRVDLPVQMRRKVINTFAGLAFNEQYLQYNSTYPAPSEE
jgi:hypothetical protein